MKRIHTYKRILIITLLITTSLWAVTSSGATGNNEGDQKQSNTTAAASPGTTVVPVKNKSMGGLFPNEQEFTSAAENSFLQLKVHEGTGHFLVVDKRNGNVWRSFPNPEGWNDSENTGVWKQHLQSPIFIRYVEFNVQKHLIKETNLKEQEGSITDFKLTDSGFKLTFSMPDIGFKIPVEVRLKDDYVETKVIDNGLIDGKTKEEMKKYEEKNKNQKDPNARIASIRLYPFLGAETSEQEDGYLFTPDGPGALIRFKNDRASTTSNFYNERVYGEDWAYSHNNPFSIRKAIKMPVFGIKSGNRAFLAIIQDGAEYASVVAAPSKSFSQYNWATAEYGYRYKFFQPTNSRKTEGIMTHAKERTTSDRSTRYYFLDKGAADYVGMANRYRGYLMDEMGMKPLKVEDNNISLQLNLLAADTKKGFIWDSYKPLTTTSQAKDIVNHLSSMGIHRLSIMYSGWQRGGSSVFGGHFPVDSKIGGNEGMRDFTAYAHSKGHSVTLDGLSYSYNTNGRDGFRKNRDGLQDLGSVVIGNRGLTLVSPRFMEKVILEDLTKMKELGVDGIMFGGAVGQFLNSDYNEKYAASRKESREIQENIFRKTMNSLGRADVSQGNFYSLKYAKYVFGLDHEYSFDLFIDDTVPFAQIALHGLTVYSSGYANVTDNYKMYMLKNIEYGEVPAFILTYAQSQELIGTRSLESYYSTYYKDWSVEIVKQYQRFNEALGDVQDKFIVSHRTLEDGVKETQYSNGKLIIVNYNESPYHKDGISVGAKDFTVIPGR